MRLNMKLSVLGDNQSGTVVMTDTEFHAALKRVALLGVEFGYRECERGNNRALAIKNACDCFEITEL